jgi:hypothetical protein
MVEQSVAELLNTVMPELVISGPGACIKRAPGGCYCPVHIYRASVSNFTNNALRDGVYICVNMAGRCRSKFAIDKQSGFCSHEQLPKVDS